MDNSHAYNGALAR